ncbi:hypothetical protein PPRFG01_0019100 [Plasmodium sp.]|nr:hypothetical protein PPRFG01_0019100 [Plasmodium sp.]
MTENPEFLVKFPPIKEYKIWNDNFVMTCSDVVYTILCANIEKMDQNFEQKLAERAIPPPMKNFKNGSNFGHDNYEVMKKKKMLLGSSNYWQLHQNTKYVPCTQHVITKTTSSTTSSMHEGAGSEVEHKVVKHCNMLKLNPQLVNNGGSSKIRSVCSSKKHEGIVKLNPES